MGEIVRQYDNLHKEKILDLAWRNDSSFATGSKDKKITMCSIEQKEPISICIGHTHEINSISWDPSGEYLASASDDKTIRIWKWSVSECLQVLDSHTEAVYTLRWSTLPILPPVETQNTELTANNGNASSTEALGEKDIIIEKKDSMDQEKDQQKSTLSSQETPALNNDQDNDKEKDVDGDTQKTTVQKSGGETEGTMELDGEKGETKVPSLTTKTKEKNANSETTSSPSSNGVTTRAILASGSFDNSVKLWDTAKGKCLHSLSGHSNGGVYSIAFDNAAHYIAVGHADGILCVWNIADGTIFRKYQLPKGSAGDKDSTIFDVSWSSDSHRMGICSTQGKVFFIDFKT